MEGGAQRRKNGGGVAFSLELSQLSFFLKSSDVKQGMPWHLRNGEEGTAFFVFSFCLVAMASLQAMGWNELPIMCPLLPAFNGRHKNLRATAPGVTS